MASPPEVRRADLPAEPTQARRFGKARTAQSGALHEDYVELISDLLANGGEARPTDIARRLGVSHATAIKTIGRLKREGLAMAKPYRGVFLTGAGEKLAERVRARHRIVVDLLLAVGVPAEAAEQDAEGMEHHVSDTSLAASSAGSCVDAADAPRAMPRSTPSDQLLRLTRRACLPWVGPSSEEAMSTHDHSRWGPTDQIGAGNLLTVEKRLAALQSVRDGRVYDVSHEIGAGAPFMAPNQTPFLLSIWASWRDSIKRRRALGATNDAGANVERIEMTAHVGTHIDALGHFSKGDRLYNGLSAADTVTDWGLERLGIEHVPPMITRGVLLDVAGCDGAQHLNPGRVVTPDELARAEAAANVALEPGDIVLIPHRLGALLRYRQHAISARRARHRPARRALADRARRDGDRLRQHGGRGAAQSQPRHCHAGAPTRAGRGRGISDREPGAGRTGARCDRQLLLHPAGDQVPRRDGIAGAAGGDGVAGRMRPLAMTPRPRQM